MRQVDILKFLEDTKKNQISNPKVEFNPLSSAELNDKIYSAHEKLVYLI
jgi:hypothetical protein